MARDSLKGRLLVANPAMPDPNFHRTIVFMLAHGEEGAMGIILNRPTTIEVANALTGWAELAADPPVVFSGGPVDPAAAICLAQAAPDVGHLEGLSDGRWSTVLGTVGTFDLTEPSDREHPIVERVRIFAGYAGWGEGQLEGELSAGGWFVVDAEVEDLLSPQPDLMWRRVLRRQPGILSVLSTYPIDPSCN